jgi:hypothetical protein
MARVKVIACFLVGLTLGIPAIRAEAGERATAAAAARPCPEYGAGFVQVPGTETCVRIGGGLRGEVQAGGPRTPTHDIVGLRSEGRLDFDTRTQTDYGPVRTFVRVRGGNATGAGSTWDR